MELSRWVRYGLLLIPLTFLGVFFFYPLLSILDVSFRPGGNWDLSGFTRIVSSAYYRETILFTIFQAALSTILTILLALPGAYVFSRYHFPGKSWLMSLATLAFVLPTVVTAAAFSSLIGPRGLLNTILMQWFRLDAPPIQAEGTLAIILIVHVFYNYALALRIISAYWANQNTRMEEAARLLGCHGWRLWWLIRLPILRPAILAAAALIFVFTFTSFGVVLILGGPRFATLEVQIYYQTVNLFNLPLAGAMSLVQIGIMFIVMLGYTRRQRRLSTELVSANRVARRPANRGEWTLVGLNATFMAVFLLIPLAALVIRSFTPSGENTPTHYYQLLFENTRGSILFVPPIQAVLNSVVFAMMTTFLALLLGMIAVFSIDRFETQLSRWLDPIFMLPLATSAVTLGFGFIIALDEPPLNLRASWLLVPISHTLVAVPFVIRSVLPALRAVPPHLHESAALLGAPPWQILRQIDLPLIARGLIVGAVFAFTVSMGEFGASIFVSRPETPTIPVVIFRLLGQPGLSQYGQALAMSVLLLLVCALGFIVIERLRNSGIGEF